MDEELQHTLTELYDDLLSLPATSLDDASAILHSLTLLACELPQAQRHLGRHFASNHLVSSSESVAQERSAFNQKVPDGATKLSELAGRFMYQPETTRNAIALFAALAKGNPVNQQRIVRRIPGVRLARSSVLHANNSEAGSYTHGHAREERMTVFDAGKIKKKKRKTHIPVLYALTVPDSVKCEYRKWRKRRRQLQNRRLPSGTPSQQGGVPAPCHCNECLGAEQFLATWQLHFQDLSRWTADTVNNERGSTAAVHLPAASFFHIFLKDFHICKHNPLGQKENELSDHKDPDALAVYYFVPYPAEQRDESEPPPFDPLQHISAIEISPEIDVDSLKQHTFTSRSEPVDDPIMASASNDNIEDAIDDRLECVVLHEGRVGFLSCGHQRTLPLSVQTSGDKENAIAATLVHFLIQLQQTAGKSLSKSTLLGFIRKDAEQLQVLAPDHRTILETILDYIGDADTVVLGDLRGIVESADNKILLADRPHTEAPVDPETPAASEFSDMYEVRIAANESAQELVVRCTSSDPATFSASISHQQLFGNDSSPQSSCEPFALLCVDDDTLQSLLGRCRLCPCVSVPLGLSSDNDSAVIYLRPEFASDETLQDAQSSIQKQEITAESHDYEKSKPPKRANEPVPGLSDELKKSLLHLDTTLPQLLVTQTKPTFEANFATKLSSLIKGCNSRITTLAISTEAMRTIPEPYRKAEITRCRHCRDLLIQLGKQIKLVLKSPSTIASSRTSSAKTKPLLSAVEISQVTKLVRSTIAKVQQHSQCFSAWEIPDARVAKLHLNHRVWASGFPDREFHRENDSWEQENKKKQRELTQRLLAKQQRGNSSSQKQ